MIVFATDIPSAVSGAEVNLLCQLAEGKTVLEVGSDFGRSTIALASVAQKVHAVDWFQGDGHAGARDAMPGFWENLKRYRVHGKVVVHAGDAHEVLPMFRPEQFDGAFLDAFHEADAVFADACLIRPLLKPGGWLAFHDYGRFTVKEGVERFSQTFATRGWQQADSVLVLHL